MTEFEMALIGWRLTTAEIIYRMPDHQHLLQSFIWQEFDRPPKFPVLNKFLRFWQHNLDGPLHAVRVAVRGVIAPTDLHNRDNEFRLD